MIQDPREAAKYLLTLFGLAALITLFVLAVSTFGHATTTQHRNSLGVPMYTVNPYIYEAVIAVTNVSEINGNLNLRVRPVGTYLLYDETVLLCGLPLDKFQGVSEPFLMTYERQSHETVRGVGCHELLRVDSLIENTRIQ